MRTTLTVRTPDTAWTDSPSGLYANDVDSSLSLSTSVDLSGTTAPQLTFWHRYNLESGWDFGYAEASTNGTDWDILATYSGTVTNPSGDVVAPTTAKSEDEVTAAAIGVWAVEQIDLSVYTGSQTVDIRFRIASDSDIRRDGLYIDDVSIAERPTAITPAAPYGITQTTLDLSWTANGNGDFAAYQVHRSLSPAVTADDPMVAEITDQGTTGFTDTGLTPKTTFYYKAFVVNTSGTYSGSKVTSTAKSGAKSWTDSPIGYYADNVNTSLDINVSLANANSPVLTFWNKMFSHHDQDFGYVEVSTDGGTTWTTRMAITGVENDWNQERIDLNQYRGAVIGLRIRMWSDGADNADGWHIDGVRIEDGPIDASYPFSDDMESGPALWLPDTSWALMDSAASSGLFSWTDSHGTNYESNTDSSLTLTINLAGARMPVLKYDERYALEENADYGYVEVSIDGGSSWDRISFRTGASGEWRTSRVDLTEYAGNFYTMVRFRLITNSSGVSDGWSIDNVSIAETTHAELPYPFFDDFEEDAAPSAMAEGTPGNNWIMGPWDIVGPARSGTNSIHDSPCGNYAKRATNRMRLISANTIDLSGATHPQLTFYHKHFLESNPRCGWDPERDYADVYVSSFFDQSQTWQRVARFGGMVPDWTLVEIDLTAYAGFPNVRIMFAIVDDSHCGGDHDGEFIEQNGWYLDDIRVLEAPTDVLVQALTDVTMHGATLHWTENADPSFNRYEIYQALNADPDQGSTLVKTIEDRSVTEFADVYTVLQPNRYRYRMYVVDNLGGFSPGSNAIEAVYSVPINAFPFFDNMESALGNWEYGWPWGRTTSTSHDGQWSWTDSPVGSYDDNTDTSLDTRVSLSGSASPILTFWHRIAMQAGDTAFVEISTDANCANWLAVLLLSGNENWNQERIDLNPWKGLEICLRFRLNSNGADRSDGLYIDDVRIDSGSVSTAAPFTDDMESGPAPWMFDSPWGQTDGIAHSGLTSWTDSPTGDYANNADSSISLRADLSQMLMPVLNVWHRYSLETNADYVRYWVSINNGSTWNLIGQITGAQPTWTPDSFDLTEYSGNSDTIIRIQIVSNGSGTNDGYYFDDVSIVETAAPQVQYPFFDDFESSDSSWTTGGWALVGPGYESNRALTDTPIGNYPKRTTGHNRTILVGTIDLSTAEDPQLSFWYKTALESNNRCNWDLERDQGSVYISNFFGKSQTWQRPWFVEGIADWTKAEISLADYVGFTNVRIMFTIDDDAHCGGDHDGEWIEQDGFTIDDVRIDEVDNAPPNPVDDLVVVGGDASALDVQITSIGSEVDLRWTATGDDGSTGQAKEYDLRYLKDTPITVDNWSSTTPATGEPIPGPAGTIEDFTLDGLDPDSTYHEALVVIDEVGNESGLSNVVQISTFAANTVKVTINAPTEALTSTDSTISTFTVRLDVENVTDLSAANYEITFNPTVLEFAQVDERMINGTVLDVFANESTPGTVIVAQGPFASAVSGTGYLAELKFNAIGAPGSTSAISASNETLPDSLATSIPSSWTDDLVTIVSVLSGDANLDGTVNALDVTKIKRMIVRLDTVDGGADANGDGSVNALDLTKTKRIIVRLD